METLATLAMDFDVRSADPAEAKMRSLRSEAKALEEQVEHTAQATKGLGVAQGYAGTAAANAERTIRQYRNGLSEEATLLLRNAQFQANWAKEREKAARGAAREAEDLERRVRRLTASYDPLGAAVDRTNSELIEAKALFDAGALSADRYEAAVSSLNGKLAGLKDVQNSVTGSSKMMQLAGLNLGRQFADIGVQLGSGQSPFLVLIQQGPQIADIFAQAKTEGVGFKTMLRGLYLELAPILAILSPIALAVAVVGSGFALATRQINDGNKDIANGLGLTAEQLEKVKNKTVTMGDVAVGTFNAAKGALAEAFGPELKAAEKALDSFLDNLAANTVKEVKAIVGAFMGAYGAITATWEMLPGAFGDAVYSAANATLDGLSKLVNGAIGLLNPVIGAVNERFGLEVPQLDLVKFNDLRNDYAGQMAATAKVGAGAFAKGAADGAKIVDQGLAAIESETLKAAEKRIRAEAGKAKAVRDTISEYEKAVKASTEYVRALSEEVATMGMSEEQLKRREFAMKAAAAPTEELARAIRVLGGAWEYQTRVMKAAKDQTDAVTHAVNDNIKTMTEVIGDVRIPTAIENMAAEFDLVLDRTYSVARSVDDIFYSIDGHDWAGAFSGLLQTINQVKLAFDSAASSKDRIAAGAGVAMGVGNAIGGTTGAGISGAASGALAGAQLGSIIPGVGTAIGAVAGGILGGLSSLFGSSKAKKQAKAEAEAQRVAAEIARQEQILTSHRQIELSILEAQGKSIEAMALRRADELAALSKLDPALAEHQKQLYAAVDAAESAAKAQAAAADAAREAAELAANVADANIRLLEAQGKSEAALGLRRAQQLTGMPAILQALNSQIFATEDLAAANDHLSKVQSDAAKQVDDARSTLADAYEREANGYKTARDRFKALGDTIKSTLRDLMGGAASGLSPEALYQSSKAEFDRVRGRVQSGDEQALAELPAVAQAFREASEAYFGGSAEYYRDRDAIADALRAGQAIAEQQVTSADAQLAKLDQQIGGLLTINTSVLTVAQAVSGLNGAMQAQAAALSSAMAQVEVARAAEAAARAAADAAVKVANDNTPNWTSYLATNPDVAAEFARQSQENMGAIGVSSGAGFAQWHYDKYGKIEGRKPFKAGGIMDRPIALGESGVGGEAGPEGILPLANVGGKMGVHATISHGDRETQQQLLAVMREILFELKTDKVQRGAVGQATIEKMEAIADGVVGVKKAVQAAA